jgi:hypothetical protein
VAERLKAPVLKTYAPGFATLRQVTPLAKSKIFRRQGSAGLRHRSWEWALSGHWNAWEYGGPPASGCGEGYADTSPEKWRCAQALAATCFRGLCYNAHQTCGRDAI